MSKGCTVALIVAGVVVVLLIIVGVAGYFFWGDLVKTGTTQVIGQAKTYVAENPPEGVDTAQFNALADAFVERFNADENLSADKYGPIIQSIQGTIDDKQVTADEVAKIQEDMVNLYPDLKSMLPMSDSTDMMPPDSVAVMEDSM